MKKEQFLLSLTIKSGSISLLLFRLLAQTSLRNILGTKNLHEILSDRDSIAGAMQSILDEATADWGIKVERVEM